jgi:hypothetical protein
LKAGVNNFVAFFSIIFSALPAFRKLAKNLPQNYFEAALSAREYSNYSPRRASGFPKNKGANNRSSKNLRKGFLHFFFTYFHGPGNAGPRPKKRQTKQGHRGDEFREEPGVRRSRQIPGARVHQDNPGEGGVGRAWRVKRGA